MAEEKIGRLSVFGYVSFEYANAALHHLPNSDLTSTDLLFFFFFHAPRPLTINTIGLFRESGGKYIKKYKELTDVFRVKKPLLIITLRPSQRRRCGQ